MANINSRKQALEQQICELEETLAQLKQQLNSELESEQHQAIENLESYLGQVNDRFANLQEFWHLLREEILAMFSGDKKGGHNNG